MTIPKVQELHDAYESATGIKVPMSYTREFAWSEWIRRGLTVDDLRMWVQEVRYRQKQGRSDSLQFSSLIGNSDRAEENIIELRKRKRGHVPNTDRASVLRQTGRSDCKPATEAVHAGALAQELLTNEQKRKQVAEDLRKFKNSL